MAQLIHDPLKSTVLDKCLWLMAQLIYDPLKPAITMPMGAGAFNS